jgi:hypothetical protein
MSKAVAESFEHGKPAPPNPGTKHLEPKRDLKAEAKPQIVRLWHAC